MIIKFKQFAGTPAYRYVVGKIFKILNHFTWLVDCAFLFALSKQIGKQQGLAYNVLSIVCYVGIALIVWRVGKAHFLAIRSKMMARDYMRANRVIPVCGKQRVGKSSLACYMASCGGRYRRIYSNIPLKIKGRYTYKLTAEELAIKTAVPESSIMLVDEANLFYNNVKSDSTDPAIFGQSVLCQLVGHFFDGNIFYVAVDTGRLPKLIRDNYSAHLQVLESISYNYSIIGNLLLNVLHSVLMPGEQFFSGLRLWHAQHYEHIIDEAYTALLGQDEKQNMFSPVKTFCRFQDFGLSEYDDRYMQYYYQDIPEDTTGQWNSLSLSSVDLQSMYDGEVIKYLNQLQRMKSEKEEKQKSRIVIKQKEEPKE